MALITTPGGKDSDSYNTIEEADDYLILAYTMEQLESWDYLDATQKEHRLRLGTLYMDELPLRGCRACRDQNLRFPRWWKTDRQYPAYADQYIEMGDIPILPADRNNYYGSPPVIPINVKKAHIEIVFQVFHSYLLDADTEPMEYPDHEVRGFTLGGGMTIEYFSSTHASNNDWAKAKITSTQIIQTYLNKWICRVSGGVM